jgi:hypothetical protein
MKRKYEKPLSKVYELKQLPQLLQTSGKRSPYGDRNGDPIDYDWG